ncbi:MAG: 2-C-methyl-D-erythritol 4-phosphate cytidylyltransferase [Bacteroidales bacterium]|nr:2-C-methyl-D-erythritol 4-phosphate cytidylyltransferase [Bacteroidales bacterium]
MNIAAILAAGSGKRMGTETPKQFLEVNGKPMLALTIAPFQAHPNIDRIMVVASPDYFPMIDKIKEQYGFTKLEKMVEGGPERYISAFNAINACPNDDDHILIHDGARPNVSSRIIDDIITALKKANAVAVATPTTDTIYMTDKEGKIIAVPPRNQLLNAQTPQAFKVRTIKSAFEKALKNPNCIPTDDISLIINYLPEEKIITVLGDANNFKVTHPNDLLKIKDR